MLWYKSWLETRYKLLLMLFIMSLMMALQHSAVQGSGPGGRIVRADILDFELKLHQITKNKSLSSDQINAPVHQINVPIQKIVTAIPTTSNATIGTQ